MCYYDQTLSSESSNSTGYLFLEVLHIIVIHVKISQHWNGTLNSISGISMNNINIVTTFDCLFEYTCDKSDIIEKEKEKFKCTSNKSIMVNNIVEP